MICTVGDSHAWHAWLKIPGVVTNTLGPMTMYAMGRDKPIVVDTFPNDAHVVFCWGEIDCRCHVNKYQPWTDTIDAMARAYLAAIKRNALINPNILIFNVVPPPRRDGMNLSAENPAFPFLGSDMERLLYVRRLNNKLRQFPFPFIDVYDQYADADGFLRMDVSDGHVHIADERPIQKWIDTHFAEREVLTADE